MKNHHMRTSQTVRSDLRAGYSYPEHRGAMARLDEPGAFQCTILRALELRKEYRDVFLLKEIQGHTLAEIAAILGISLETVMSRWKRARRDLWGVPDSDALEHSQ
jgi:DNA-directed RNA polymerase specialized sigma24 family protein